MRTIKRLTAGLLALLIVCTLFPAQALAAGGKRCYTISSGNTTVYSNTGLSKKYGTIYGSDEVTVLSVTSSYCRVQYPIGGGRTKTGYIRTGAILLGTGGSDYKATAKITTYKRPGGGSYGYISKGDTVKVLGTSGSYVQVKYPVSGGYKYAFVTKTNAEKYIYGSSSSSTAVSSGTYVLYTALTGGKVLDADNAGTANGTNLQLWEANGTGAQTYTVTKLSSGWYKIKNTNSGKCMDVSGGSSSAGANVQLWEDNGTSAQKWRFVSAGGGYYYIQNALGNYLDVDCAGTANGTNVKVYALNGSSAQKWKLVAASAGTASSDCYPRYTGSSGSIVTALNSLGIDSSYSFRKQIAIANGITNYTGTASQNTTLLNLLKQGRLKKAGTSSASSSGGSSSSSGGLEVHSSYNISVSNKAARNKPHYTNSAGSRSKDNLNAVIDQFLVASNARYRKNSNGTYCNIFAWDVTSALNAEIPHWIKNNAPAEPGASGAHELTANATYNWLRDYGGGYGWYRVSAKQAQDRANSGYPTVAVWKNPTGKSGHIAVVRPEGSGYYYSSGKGPVIAQAGGSNYNRTNVSTGFGSSKMSAILYYTHD